MLVSIVIPTCHRNDLLDRCLDSLRPDCQGVPAADYEVIVTDDGRRTTAQAMMAEKYSEWRWVAGPRRGPAANRNNGAQQAQGDWVAFVDDDCIAAGGWLAALIKTIRADGLDVIEGQTETPDYVDNPFRMGVTNLHGGVYWSCNLAVRRAAFEAIGRFDEDFLEAGGEDMEFAHRLQQRGLRARFVPEVLIYHPVRVITFRGWLWRTFLIRWILLYGLKTGKALPLGTNRLWVLAHLVRNRVMELLRTSWHVVKRARPGGWRTMVFNQAWKWLTFPVVLPYLMYWELRFRRQLAARAPSA